MRIKSLPHFLKPSIALTLGLSSQVLYAQNDLNDALNKQHNTQLRIKKLSDALFTTPYSELPYYKVNRKLFGPSGDKQDNHLLQAARRTFDDSSDLIDLPSGQKLLNANGICFIGQWKINQDNPFTGLYKSGTQSTAIVRASVALSGTQQKHKRAFGMAIKLLPDDLHSSPSLNAFVLHSIGGTKTEHVLDLSMDNQPPLGRLPSFRNLSTALRLRNDLEKADKEQGAKKPSVSFRPINHFAHYQQVPSSVIEPKWLRLRAITQTRVDKNDFRDELNIKHYPNNEIRYEISVAAQDNKERKSKAKWHSIGELVLTQSVTSQACDTRLHFQHPKLTQ